jgi:hypothetical protein
MGDGVPQNAIQTRRRVARRIVNERDLRKITGRIAQLNWDLADVAILIHSSTP